jgi:hypothetical protein
MVGSSAARRRELTLTRLERESRTGLDALSLPDSVPVRIQQQ